MGALVVGFGPILLSIYSNSPEVISAGMIRIVFICSTYVICGMMDVMVGLLRGVGHSVLPMLVSLVGVCFLRLAMLLVLFQIPQFHTIQVVYLTYPISWIITFLAHLICFQHSLHHILSENA